MFAESCASGYRRLKVLLLAFGLAASVNARAADTFDPATGVLTIPLLVIGNTAFSNVRITVGGLVGVSGGAAVNSYDTFSGGQLSIPALQLGANVFTNVVITVGSVLGVGGATPAFVSAPVLVPVNPLAAATVGQAYSRNVVGGVWPSSTYTYSIDTLANGSLPSGMTLHIDGTLSGTPFATGRTDVSGHQIPNTFTFGVCATDTLSRVTSSPCPQTSITVNPAASTLTVSKAGTGSGTVTSLPAGIACGASCSANFASSGATVTLTATPASGSTFTGWSGACSGTGACAIAISANTAVTANFSAAVAAAPINLVGTWAWSGHGSNGCSFHDGGTFSMLLTLNGSSYTATNVSATGIEFRDDATCAVAFINTGSGGTASGTISGNTLSLRLDMETPDGGLFFTGSGVVSGSTINFSIVRDTDPGAVGTISLTAR
jgi:hypothetical protein